MFNSLSKRKIKFTSLAVVLLLFAAIASYFTFFSGAASPNGLLVYRGVSNGGRDHYYTPLNYAPDPNYQIEGPAFWAFNQNEPGTVRVSRWWNGAIGAHYLTIPGQNPGEADGTSGWDDDSNNNGGTFNVFASPQPDNPHIVPIYLWFVAGNDYIYSTDGFNAPAPGWTNAGVKFYAADSDPSTWEPADTVPPTGFLDSATCQTVWGWARDDDAPNAPVTVHIYVDDQFVASVVAGDYGNDVGNHRFTYTFPVAYSGSHTVQAYGISLNREGAKGKDTQNALLNNGYLAMDMSPCTTVTPPEPADTVVPTGFLDSATCQTVWGWARDDDAPNAPVTVHIYVDDQFVASVVAGDYGNDVGNHRFTYTFPVAYSGSHTVQAYGISLNAAAQFGKQENSALLANGNVTMDMGPCTVTPPPPPVEPLDTIAPTGFLDGATCQTVWGWARDEDSKDAPVTVHIYIDNRFTYAVVADKNGNDVGNHRFEFTFPEAYSGAHTVQVYAISLNAAAQFGKTENNVLLTNGDITMNMGPCTPVTPPDPPNIHDPEGFVDNLDCRIIQGWALDRDAINATTVVHVYIDDAVSPSVTAITDQLRNDVNSQYGTDANALHGYTVVIPDIHRTSGSHAVRLYALDLAGDGQYSGGARNKLIGDLTYNCADTGPKNDYDPQGVLDTAECSIATGWVLDRDAINTATRYHIYIDGGTPYDLETTEYRPDVQTEFASMGADTTAKHGFIFTIPDGYKGQGTHRIELYALDHISTGEYIGVRNAFIGAKEYTCSGSGGVPATSQHAPLGRVDSTEICKLILGWTFDLDTPSTSITYHVYLDNVHIDSKTTDKLREDVNNFYPGVTGRHGFEYSMAERNLTGIHSINVYAIDYDNEGNFGDASKNVWIGGGNVDCGDPTGSAPRTNAWAPTGVVDDNSCKLIRGWAFDPDMPTRSIQVHIYIDGEGTPVNTTTQRDDVNVAHQITGIHGFAFNPDRKYWDSQIHTAFVHAIDINSAGDTVNGTNTLIGNVSWACDAQGNEIKIVPPAPPTPGDSGGSGNIPIGGTISFPSYCPAVGVSAGGIDFGQITKVGDGQATSGQAVRELQTCLNDLGFDAGPVDGQWGPRTRSALVSFVHLRQAYLIRDGRPSEFGEEVTSDDELYAGINLYRMIYFAALEGFINPSRTTTGAVNTRGTTTPTIIAPTFTRRRLDALGYPKDGSDQQVILCFQGEWKRKTGAPVPITGIYDRDTDSYLSRAENSTDEFGEKWLHHPYSFPCFGTSEQGNNRPPNTATPGTPMTSVPTRYIDTSRVQNVSAKFDGSRYMNQLDGVAVGDFDGLMKVMGSYIQALNQASTEAGYPRSGTKVRIIEKNGDGRDANIAISVKNSHTWTALKYAQKSFILGMSRLPLKYYGQSLFSDLYFGWEVPGIAGYYSPTEHYISLFVSDFVDDNNNPNPSAAVWMSTNTAVHEFGHAYHWAFNGGAIWDAYVNHNPAGFFYNDQAENSVIWNWRARNAYNCRDGQKCWPGFPSEYGMSYMTEDFADLFKAYLIPEESAALEARSSGQKDHNLTFKGLLFEDMLLR